jgi:ABC-type uncharacterized transport system substrate-binding protein
MRRPFKKTALGSILFAGALLAAAVTVEAQQPKRVARIGYLSSGSPTSAEKGVEAFRQALRELGYVEGHNISIESHFAEEVTERLPNLAADLVQRNVEVIVATGTPAAQAAKNATQKIPIVMQSVSDPVGTGLIASLAHPGGNVTGVSNLYEELGGKQLELLKEAFPKISRVAVLWDPANAAHVVWLGKLRVAAETFRTALQPVKLHSPNDLEPAFAALKREGSSAFIVLNNALTADHRVQIVDFAAKSRLPAMYPVSGFAESGGLMSYGPSDLERYRRVAAYVDKILKGTKPEDLPVEQPTKFEFVINLKAAKQIGLTIPPNVLARADRVIK